MLLNQEVKLTTHQNLLDKDKTMDKTEERNILERL